MLDFGCGVGDYGCYFARRRWRVGFHDVPAMIEFVRFRCRRAGIEAEFFPLDEAPDCQALFRGFDAVVFGEVLEHLVDPLGVLKSCVAHAAWIVTSSYPLPHGPEYWTRYPDHTLEARAQQPACLGLLQSRCECLPGEGMLRIWRRR